MEAAQGGIWVQTVSLTPPSPQHRQMHSELLVATGEGTDLAFCFWITDGLDGDKLGSLVKVASRGTADPKLWVQLLHGPQHTFSSPPEENGTIGCSQTTAS